MIWSNPGLKFFDALNYTKCEYYAVFWACNSSPGPSVSTDRITASLESWEPGGVLPIMAYRGQLCPKGVWILIFEVYERVWKSVIVVIKKDPKD